MERKELSQLRQYSLLLCVSLAFAFAGFQTVNAQDNLPPRVQSAVSPESTATVAQTRENTPLPSKRYKFPIDYSETIYTLSGLDLARMEKRAANQIGVERTVNISIRDYGKSYKNADGSELRILSIKSPGAFGVRVHIEDFDIPDGDEVYIYGTLPDSQVAGPYKGTGPWGDKEFWSGTVEGETAIIEYYSKTGHSDFRVSEISHIYESPNHQLAPETMSCEVDASCSSNTEKNAVARIVFQDNGSFVCTGTLLNDRNSTLTPYFLTARHCVSTQTVAQTVETYWFYQTTSCNSGVLRSGIVHGVSGTTLLVTNQPSDSTLLKLVGAAPAGTVFSGWDAGVRSAGTPVFGFHHPDGGTPPNTLSFLRRADGQVTNATTGCSASGMTNGYFITWSSGLTEPGSSGSGLWYSSQGNSYLVGVDSCGPINLNCNYNGNTYALYGKFSDFYPLIQSYIYPAVTVKTSFDFDGDGKADISVFRPSSGYWYFTYSGNGVFNFLQFGINGDLITPSDFDGDGRADVSIYRPSTGYWYRINSSNNTFALSQFGQAGDVPAPGDFDGDGKADISVYRPSTGAWYRINSSNNQFVFVQFGQVGDIPAAADYDADGRTDQAVYRPSNGTWWMLRSTAGFTWQQFGINGDVPTPSGYGQ